MSRIGQVGDESDANQTVQRCGRCRASGGGSRRPGLAHHSFAAEFDAKKPVKLRGTVVEDGVDQPALLDPHRREESATARSSSGWSKAARRTRCCAAAGTRSRCPPGTEIIVEGFQAKDGANRANGRDITFPDGKKLFVGSSGTGASGRDDPTSKSQSRFGFLTKQRPDRFRSRRCFAVSVRGNWRLFRFLRTSDAANPPRWKLCPPRAGASPSRSRSR